MINNNTTSLPPQIRVTLIGAGNVAYHLGYAITKAAHMVLWQVYSRTTHSLQQWPFEAQQPATDQIEGVDTNADLYIIAVSDDAISWVAQHLPALPRAIVVHTSGTAPLQHLARFEQHGIFYPLQTFSRSGAISIDKVPFILSANTPAALAMLQDIVVQSLQAKYYILDEQQRQYLHLAAVFANNFTNYMNIIANDILAQQNLPFELLHPLINETAHKICRQPPLTAQTGPAKRNDQTTMAHHMQLLAQYPPQFAAVYSNLSEQISSRFN